MEGIIIYIYLRFYEKGFFNKRNIWKIDKSVIFYRRIDV